MSVTNIRSSVIDINRVVYELNSFISNVSDIYSIDNTPVNYTLIRKNLFPTKNIISIETIVRNIENIVRFKFNLNAFSMDFYCEEIIVKSNIRIQKFNKNDISVKLYLHKKNNDLSGEIEARKILKEKLPEFKLAPDLINYDKEKAEWIVEEYVELAMFQHSKIQKLVKDVLPKLYDNTHYYDGFNKDDYPSLSNTMNVKVRNIIKKIENENLSIPYAYCHGDMAKSNILKDTRGNVLISDWENSQFRPICTDLCGLYLHHKKVRAGILKLLDSYTMRQRNSISSQVQIALALEAFLNTIIEKSGGKLNRKQRSADQRGRAIIEELLNADPLLQ